PAAKWEVISARALRAQENLADAATGGDLLQGRGRVRKRVNGRDNRMHLAFFIHFEERLHGACDAGRVTFAVSAPMKSYNGDVLEQDPVCLNGRDASRSKAHDQKPSLKGDALLALVKDVSAHRIVNHIHASPRGCLLDLLDPIQIAVVKNLLSSVGLRGFELLFRAGGGKHMGAQRPADLHRRQ